jgi:hypothetical protein
MRIAQIAPLIESVPPWLYGGTASLQFVPPAQVRRHGEDKIAENTRAYSV